MATVKINGQNSPSNMVCFSDAINIVEYDSSITGENSTITLEFGSNLYSSVTADSQYYITILDETITNVMSPKNATNRRFYIGDSGATAAYVARALEGCDSLSADYNISSSGNIVTLKAKTIGSKLNVQSVYSTNITTSSGTLLISYSNGTASSYIWGGKVALIIRNDEEQFARLEKNLYTNDLAWNISPVISSLAEYGKLVPFTTYTEELYTNGTVSQGSLAATNFVTYGYLANQSSKYLPLQKMILLNDTRGSDKMTLYTYSNEIPFTVLSTDSAATANWSAYTSANSYIGSGNTSSGDVVNYMAELTATIPTSAFSQAYYIIISYGTSSVKYNVIKPIKAAEGYTRIYWRNEYGGISFFDFTSSRSERDNVEVETYQKNFYDFYDHSTTFEQDKIYKSEISKEVKVKSHLMEKNGKYIANSLIRSKRIWTVVNGNTHYVVPVNIEVNEEDNYNDIYTITFTYKYSTLS